MKGLDLLPRSSMFEEPSSSQQAIVCNAVIAHNSRRAQVDKRHKNINDEIVMLQKQLLLVDKRCKLDKAIRKMKRAKKKRIKDSESDSSESDSDERTKTKKNKKKRVCSSRISDSSSSLVPSTSAGKPHDTSSRRPPSSSDSSSSSEDRKKRRRPSDKSLSRKRSPKQSPPSHRSKRSPSTHQSRRSPSTHRSRRSPSNHRLKRLPSTHRLKRSPSTHQSRRSPSTHRLKRSPSTHQSRRLPSTYRLKRSPSTHRSRRSPSNHRLKRLPSTHRLKRSPSTHQSRRSPSTHRLKRSPSTHQSRRLPSTYRLKRSPSTHQSRRSPSTHRLKRSPSTHQSRRSPASHWSTRSPAGHLSKWSPALRAWRSPYGRHSPYSHSRTSLRSYWSNDKFYYNQDRRCDSSSHRPNPGIVFVDRSHRALSATVTEIHDEYDTFHDEEYSDEPAEDRDELEEGELYDDDYEPGAERRNISSSLIVIPDSPGPDKDRDRSPESEHGRTPERRRRRSPDNSRHKNIHKPIKQERMIDEEVPDMLKPKIERDSKTIKEEQYKKKVKVPSRNPKFYLPIANIVRQMRFEIRKIEVLELKNRLIDILWIIIRLRIKDMMQGISHYMSFKHIVELYREHFVSSEDGELVASVVRAVQAGAFKDFVPSDDEEQPKTEDFSEFLPYVPSKKNSDENKENEGRNDDVMILEENVDVVDITDAQEDENQRLSIENVKKDVTEATDVNKQIRTESVSIKIEPTLCRLKKEKSIMGDIPKLNENSNLTQMGVFVIDDVISDPITHNAVVELNRDIKVENAKETACIKKEKDPVCIKTEKESGNVSTKVNERSMTDVNSGPSHIKQEVAETIDNFARLVTNLHTV